MANHPDERLLWPAPERNKGFILEVLRDVLLETILDGSLVLEIGSGSGARTCHFVYQYDPHFPLGILSKPLLGRLQDLAT